MRIFLLRLAVLLGTALARAASGADEGISRCAKIESIGSEVLFFHSRASVPTIDAVKRIRSSG